MHIVPAILTDKKDVLKKMIHQSEKFCNLVQIDIMDGKFVPTKSISSVDLTGVKTKIQKEIHLMVKRPIPLLKSFKDAGACRIIFHFESEDDPWQIIKETRELKMQAGIAINPETQVSEIEDFLMAVDQILVMTVNPGYYGSPFLPETLEKIKVLKEMNGKFIISADGGIKMETIEQIKSAGVDLACVGSGVFGGDNPEENYKKLLSKISDPVFSCPQITNIVNRKK